MIFFKVTKKTWFIFTLYFFLKKSISKNFFTIDFFWKNFEKTFF